MSLVEKALLKARAQAAAPASVQPATVEVTTEVSRERHWDAPALAPGAMPEKVVHVNAVALRAAGMLAPEHEARVIASQYRQIKRPLIQNALT